MSGPSRGSRGASSAAQPPPPSPDDIARLLAVVTAAESYLDNHDCEREPFLRARMKKAVERLHE